MYYVISTLIVIIIVLLVIRVQLKVEKKEKFKIFLVIGGIYKKKLNKEENSDYGFKEFLETINRLNKPILDKILTKSTVKKVDVTASFNLEDNPYIIFSGHLLLLELRKQLILIFKKIKKERYQVLIGNKKLEGKLILSIGLIKLVIIILSNYPEFKMIIKKGEA